MISLILKSLFIIVIGCFSGITNLYASNTSIDKHFLKGMTIRKYLIKGNISYLIDSNSNLYIINLKNGKSECFKEKKVLGMFFHKESLLVFDKNNKIFEYKKKKFKEKYKHSSKIEKIFSLNSRIYIVSNRSIIEIPNNQKWIYFKNKNNNQDKNRNLDEIVRKIFYLDKSGCLWIGHKYGEFGSDLFVFNLKKKENVKINNARFYLNNRKYEIFDSMQITSISEYLTNRFYITFGRKYYGCLFSCKKKGLKCVFDKIYINDHMLKIGHVKKSHYNKFNKRIYYLSFKGFFSKSVFESRLNPWKFEFNPEKNILQKSNIKDFLFLDKNRMFILTYDNGFFILYYEA